MALNLTHAEVERLAAEIARMTEVGRSLTRDEEDAILGYGETGA